MTSIVQADPSALTTPSTEKRVQGAPASSRKRKSPRENLCLSPLCLRRECLPRETTATVGMTRLRQNDEELTTHQFLVVLIRHRNWHWIRPGRQLLLFVHLSEKDSNVFLMVCTWRIYSCSRLTHAYSYLQLRVCTTDCPSKVPFGIKHTC